MGMGGMMRGGQPTQAMLEKVELKTSPWVLVKRLGVIIRQYQRQLWWSIVTVLAASGLQMLMPLAFKHVIDVTIPAHDVQQLLLIGVGLTLMQGARYGLGYAQRYLIALVSQQLVYRVAKDLFEHIQRLSLRFFERWGTGEIISRVTNDIQV